MEHACLLCASLPPAQTISLSALSNAHACCMLHAQICAGALFLVQVWCLAVSTMGDFAVTSGADRALRIWQRTEEPFFVEEEKEKRLESLFEADLEVLSCPVRDPAFIPQNVHLFPTWCWCEPSVGCKPLLSLRPGHACKS